MKKKLKRIVKRIVPKPSKTLFMIMGTVFLVFLLVLPGLMNMWVRHSYSRLLDFYNSQGNFKVAVKKYKSHWYSADAVLSVQKLDMPQVIDLTVNQHISYGPIIIAHSGMPLFKLALIHSELQLSADTAKVIQLYNVDKPMLELDDDVSFTGKYKTHFHANGFKIVFSSGDELQLQEASGDISVKPHNTQIAGTISISYFVYTSPQITVTVPAVDLNFKDHKSASNLWIGKNNAAIKSLTLEDGGGKTIMLSGIQAEGKTAEVNGKLSAIKHVLVDSFQFNEIMFGPLELQFSAADLNAEKAAEVFAVYQKIYYSAEKMPVAKQIFTLFPSLIYPDSTLQLDYFKLNTMDGNVVLNGKAGWQHAHPTSYQTTTEFLAQANAQGYMRISTSLAKQLLSLAADVKFVAHRMTNPHLAFIEAPKSVDTVEMQNKLMLAVLIETGQLPQTEVPELIKLQQSNPSLDDYTNTLNKLYNSHLITLTAKKMLRHQYESLQLASLPNDEKLQYIENKFQDDFYGWVKDGYVKEEGKDYIVSINYQQGKLQVNGKSM